MRHILKWLTGVAGISLLSMVGLQIFWLQTSFREQKRIFLADAEHTLFTVFMQQTMDKITQKDSLMAQVFQKLSLRTALADAGPQPAVIAGGSDKPSLNIQVTIADTVKLDTNGLSQLVAQIRQRRDSGKKLSMEELSVPGMLSEQSKLDALRDQCAQILRRKGYSGGLQLAVVNGKHFIEYATCDTATFKKIGIRTDPNWLKDDTKTIDEEMIVAFPGAGFYLLKKMGGILTVSCLLILLCLSSSTYLLVLFFRQKRLSEVRNDFMNNMTHELKTPISSVSVALELMGDAAGQHELAKVEEYRGIAQGELNRLTMLVEKVLKIAAFEKSDIDIRKEHFLAAGWLQQVTNSFKHIFETGGVVFSTQVKPELLMMNGDKTHLTNVVQNLIDNALKYNDKSRPVIDVIVQETHNELYLMVKDNGMGIASADQQKVFEKFYRVPQGNRHNVKGYGLGLSYVKEIVRLHQGTILLESVPGQGSTFIIILPK